MKFRATRSIVSGRENLYPLVELVFTMVDVGQDPAWDRAGVFPEHVHGVITGIRIGSWMIRFRRLRR